MQNKITSINATPVTPPTTTAYIMARGASTAGRGISSVICSAASKPMSDSALCSRPRIHAMPSGQPVSFRNSAKTNPASFLSEVASRTILMTTTPSRDQYSAASFQRPRIRLPRMLAPVVKARIARKIRYVRHSAIT